MKIKYNILISKRRIFKIEDLVIKRNVVVHPWW